MGPRRVDDRAAILAKDEAQKKREKKNQPERNLIKSKGYLSENSKVIGCQFVIASGSAHLHISDTFLFCFGDCCNGWWFLSWVVGAVVSVHFWRYPIAFDLKRRVRIVLAPNDRIVMAPLCVVNTALILTALSVFPPVTSLPLLALASVI